MAESSEEKSVHLAVPKIVDLTRLIKAEDLEEYRSLDVTGRVEVRSYLRHQERTTSPGASSVTLSTGAAFIAILVSIIVVSFEVDGGRLTGLFVTILLAVAAIVALGGVVLVREVGRANRRNAMVSSWLAEIESAEGLLTGDAAKSSASSRE